MNNNDRSVINEYKNYLIRSKLKTTEIHMNIKTIEDIKKYECCAKSSLDKLEKLSTKYKLYDKDYDEFRIYMGKFAMGLNKAYKLNININDKNNMINIFLNLNNKFEDLERKNIMKDAYVWKIISEK